MDYYFVGLFLLTVLTVAILILRRGESPAVLPPPAVVETYGVSLLEVRGNVADHCVTVTYGKGDSQKKCQVHIPEHLPERHLANIPLTGVLDELPPGWYRFLMEHPEAKF